MTARVPRRVRLARGDSLELRFSRYPVPAVRGQGSARGESAMKYKSSLNVLKDTYDYSCY